MTVPGPQLHLEPDGLQYSFGCYCLQPDGTLLRDSAVVSLPPKELQILRLLIARAGQVIPAKEIREAVWGEVHVSTDSLPRCISSLRTRLDSPDCIQTLYKRGYRFNLPVTSSPAERSSAKFVERRAARFCSVSRLAILPFATGGGVPEYFGPGIAEQTIFRLSRTRNGVVDVVARDSVFNLAMRGGTAQEVATELFADLAITGTIVALPQHFRLRAEMIRVVDATQLWSEDFLVPHDLLSHADIRLARQITARIRDVFVGPVAPVISRPLSPSAAASTRHNGARRSQAYALYMQACAQWNTLELHQMQDAIRGFHQAIDLDESLLAARVRLMHAYLEHSSLGYMRADLAAELARKQAEIVQSQSQSTNGHSVHAALGWIHCHHDRDFASARTAFSRSQHTGYNRWNIAYQVHFALAQSRCSEAVDLLRAAVVSDPYSPFIHGLLTWALHLAGDANAALEQAEHSLVLFPDRLPVTFFSAIVFAAAGNATGTASGSYAAQATELATRLIQSSPSFDAGYATLAYAQARQGRIIEAGALLDRQHRLSRERFVMSSFHAPALVELGEIDAAIEALTTADEQHCPWLFELLGDPRLQPLHGEPEFERLRNLIRNGVPLDVSVA